MLNYAAMEVAELKTTPYPYLVIRGAVQPSCLKSVLEDFPPIEHPGSIPVGQTTPGPAFRALLDELEGDDFRALVARRFGLDLAGYPVVSTLRGVMRQKDGRIHTDSSSKVITVLLYLNETWEGDDGQLRILRGGDDLEDFVEQVPPLAGNMVIFQVTDNCWHGHTPVVGERRSIQLNYLHSAAARGKHRFFHNLSARLKQLRSAAS